MNYVGGMLRDPRKNCGRYFGAWSSLVYGSLRGYSRRIARAFLGSEARGQHPSDIDEVIGNDSETHPAMHARVTFIEAAAESVASLEHADAPFATDTPFLSFAEPGGLARFSFADDFAGVFKQTDYLTGRVGDTVDDPGARLAHDLLHPGKHRVDLFFHALQGRLLQHVSGALDSLDDLLREAFGLSHHLSGRAQQFAITLLQLFLNLRSAPAAGPSDLD